MADEQFVFLTFDVVNGQTEAFAQAQAATVDEFEWGAVAAQAYVREQIVDLLAGQHGWETVMIFGADLGKDLPLRFAQEIDEAHFGGGQGLADGFGLPMLFEFNKQEVVAQLRLGDDSGVTGEMLVDEPDLAIIGVACSIGVVVQSQQVGEPGHGLVGVIIIHGVGVVSSGGPNAWRNRGLGSPLALLGEGRDAVGAVRFLVDVAGE